MENTEIRVVGRGGGGIPLLLGSNVDVGVGGGSEGALWPYSPHRPVAEFHWCQAGMRHPVETRDQHANASECNTPRPEATLVWSGYTGTEVSFTPTFKNIPFYDCPFLNIVLFFFTV